MPSRKTYSRFKNIERLEQSPVASLFSAEDRKTNQRLLIRSIKIEILPEAARRDIEQQLDHLKRLDIPDLIVPELETFDDDIQVISPYPSGLTFNEWLKDHNSNDVQGVLEFGISLLDGLVLRHRAALIHKSIKPSSIRVEQDPFKVQLSNEVQLIDSKQFNQFADTPYYIREVLPYLSPEMGGRIRNHVGYCDLYAVGIVLYECITGAPPFLSDDSLSILHSHLAEQPRPAIELNEQCPPILSDIVDLLLQKQPENRYQSADGLRSDLQTCLSTLITSENNASGSRIPVFQLMQHESNYRFSNQSVLVGRDGEHKKLLNEYKRVCDGTLGVVTLSGISGSGKTRLVQELEIPIVAQRGYFTFGKFNQYSTERPYTTLLGAFNRLILQILSEDRVRIQRWRDEILQALGVNGQLIVDLVPELELIIGEQPEVLSLSVLDERSRFADLFSRFIGSLATEAHPLVLFIDDMQWCDQDTIDLLQLLYANPERHPYLLIIAAYRSNEVDDNHPVRLMESTIEQSSQNLLKLSIGTLEEPSINRIIAHTLNADPSHTEALSRAIYRVSDGNPLYAGETVRWLHENERLHLAQNGRWEWDDSQIFVEDIPDNITAFFVGKISGIAPTARDLLSTGALLGAQFESIDLADIAGISVAQLYTEFDAVFSQGILQAHKGRLSFLHDQVQAAAADFLNVDQRKERHLLIARGYIDRIGSNQSVESIPQEHIFSIVAHLAAGRIEQPSDEQRFEEAKFNFHAGIAAMASLTLDACNHYLTESVQLCTIDDWASDYEFMLLLHKQLARAALVNGDQISASAIIETSIKHARTDFERAEFFYEQSLVYSALGNNEQAIVIGRRALALVNDELPPTSSAAVQEYADIEARLYAGERDIWQEVMDTAPVDVGVNLLIHGLYSELIAAYYFINDIDMAALLSIRLVEYSLDKGTSGFSCHALGCTGLIYSLKENFDLAYKYEAATLQLVKRHPNTFGAVKATLALEWSTLHLRFSAQEIRGYCQETAEMGSRCGELRYAGLTYVVDQWYAFAQGGNIASLHTETNTACQTCQQYSLALPLAVGEAMLFALKPLVTNDITDEDRSKRSIKIAQWESQKESTALASYYIYAAVIAYYDNRYQDSERYLTQAELHLFSVSTSILEKLWFVFKYLLALKNGFTEISESYYEKISMWAEPGPIMKPYLALIDAEITAKNNDLREARNGYLDAIDSANQAGYVLLEAFLSERLYQHLDHHEHHTAENYRHQANLLYKACGTIKQIVKPVLSIVGSDASNGLTEIEPPNNSPNINNDLDVRFLFDAVKSISSELNLNKLMGTILSAVMARLGAKNGYLLIVEDNLLQATFKGIKYEDVSIFSRDDESFNTDTLSLAIANYVYNSKDTVILGNASKHGEFISDRVVINRRLQSILCIPIVMQQQVLGVLYFENSLIESVFTAEQVDQADLLTSQAAIALQNSKLLSESKLSQSVIEAMNRDLESKVKERTEELERKQLELTHAGRLASLGELATGIAHELGQPLQIIQAASRIIQDELEDRADAVNELIPFTRDIAEQVDRATAIITNMRSYARNDDSDAAIQVDVTEPFNQCLVFFNKQFHQHQIELIIELEDKLPVVTISPQKFQQIVVNLFSNARYAVDKKSENTEQPYQKKVTANIFHDKSRNSVVLQIKDNGIGMSNAELEKCMSPFYTTKEVGEGTGLGLSIVRSLIDEFKFSLEIESELTIGSTFRVRMPISPSVDNPTTNP